MCVFVSVSLGKEAGNEEEVEVPIFRRTWVSSVWVSSIKLFFQQRMPH